MVANNKKYESGFGAIVILVVLVVMAIGGIGFFIYSHHTRTAPASAATDTPPSPAPSKAVTTPVDAVPTTTGSNLVIKEWGITIPLSASVADAYYVPSNNSSDADGSVNTIWIGMKSRDTAVCNAALGNTGGSKLGSVVRTLPEDTDPVTGKLYSELYTGVVIGKYFYGFSGSKNPNNQCGSVDSRAEINAAFGNAAKNAKSSTTQSDTTSGN